MNIRYGKVRNLEVVQKLMAELPWGVKITAMKAFNEYLIGDERHGLRYEPRQVTHDENNPYLWQSEKQRRAFFATDGFGQGIPTQRTHETVNGWTMQVKDSNWTQVKLVNESKGAYWVQGDGQQRGHAADGWRKIGDIIATNTKGALQAAFKAVTDYLNAKVKK